VRVLRIAVELSSDARNKQAMPNRGTPSEGSDRPSLAVHLVNKPPKEHLDFRELIIWGRSANIGL